MALPLPYKGKEATPATAPPASSAKTYTQVVFQLQTKTMLGPRALAGFNAPPRQKMVDKFLTCPLSLSAFPVNVGQHLSTCT